MKTRRSRKSFELPPPPRRRNKRKSLKLGRRVSGTGRPLKAVNESIVVLSDSEGEEIKECPPVTAPGGTPENDDDIQVIDIAEASDADSSQVEEVEEGEVISPKKTKKVEKERKKKDQAILFIPLIPSTVLHSESPTSSSSPIATSPSDDVEETETKHSPTQASVLETEPEPSVPVIDIGDDDDESQSQCGTQTVEDDDDGLEVVAVLISAKQNQRLSRGSIKRKRSSIGEQRKSGGNFAVMQGSIKKAKELVRRSSSSTSNRGNQGQVPIWRGNGNPFAFNGIAANSRQISRSKKRKIKNKLGRVWQQGQGWVPQPHQYNFNRNRERELNREVIFRPGSNANPVEGITVNVTNCPRVFPNPFFNPFDPCGQIPGSSRNEQPGSWISKKNRRPTPIAPGSNIMNAGEATNRPQGTLRPIVIDGSNVAVGHGGMLPPTGPRFSARGIKICVDYFIKRGHQEIVAFVPRYRLKRSECRDPELLEEMERDGHVRFTPSREAGGDRIASYDDLFVVQYAHETGGVIISNDNFKDLFDRDVNLRETIRFRILQYTWITQGTLMFPEDPLGRSGPSLDGFLRF